MLDIDVIIARYLDAWAREDVPALMKLLHPKAVYFDAYWVEVCSGKDLGKYFAENFATETRRYEITEEPILTPDGFIIRSVAYKKHDVDGLNPLFNCAEIVRLADGLIVAINDIYCDPNPQELLELADELRDHQGKTQIAEIGLSARVSARIKRRLSELADQSTIYRDPLLTVTMLADRVGCSVMHLFHVLEVEKGTTFQKYVNECRVRYSTGLLSSAVPDNADIEQIAEESGFGTSDEFHDAFRETFSMSPEEYARRFSLADQDSAEPGT